MLAYRWSSWQAVTAYLCGVACGLLLLSLLDPSSVRNPILPADTPKDSPELVGDPRFALNDGLPLAGVHIDGVPVAKMAQGNLPWNTENTGFQEVVPGIFWIYSAFVDERYGSAFTRVRLNCLASRYKEHSVHCRFATSSQSRRVEVKATESMTGEEVAHGKEYAYVLYQCTVPTNLLAYFGENMTTIRVNYTATHSRVFNATMTKSLKLPAPGVVSVKKYKLAVCTNPIFLSRRIVTPLHLVEFMEWHLMAGYQLIVVQNFARLSELERVLRHYEKLGVLMLLNWDLPVAQSETLLAGKPLAINDCVSRLVGLAEFVAIHDSDEFIMTQDPSTTIPDLIDNLFQAENVACNGFYTTTFKLNVLPVDHPFDSVPITQQNLVIMHEKGHPRTVVRPEMIDLMAISLPLQCVPPPCQCSTQTMVEDIFVAAYRTCWEAACPANLNQTDNLMMTRHGVQLLKRMTKAARDLGLEFSYRPEAKPETLATAASA